MDWLVVAIIAGSIIAAWIHIRGAAIWYDEAITLLTTSGHAIPNWSLGMQQFKPTTNLLKILQDLYEYDVHPPLYFWVLALWRATLGSSLEVARSLSAVFTVATLVALYRYAVSLNGRWPFIPVALYAFSSVGLRYAYNARPYAMATFLVVLTLILSKRKSNWTGLCAACCVATHYFTALCVGPIVAIECFRSWRMARGWAVITSLSFIAFCMPLTVLLAKHVEARPHQYPGFGPFRKEVTALLRASLEGAVPHSSLGVIWKLALLTVGTLAILGAVWAIRHGSYTLPLSYAGFLFSFLATAIVTGKSISKMPNDYYLGVGAPLLVLLVWLSLSAIPLAVPILALIFLGGSLTATPIMEYTNYRAMVAEMRRNCNHCAIVVGYGYGGAVPACILYEARDLDVYLLKAKDSIEEMDKQLGANRVIYLVPSNDPPTAAIENEFIVAHHGVKQQGYFRLSPNVYATQ